MQDFHCHVLPSIDDGAEDIAECERILKMLTEQGVTQVVATPHFRADTMSLTRFLEKRTAVLGEVLEATRNKNYPSIIPGAEVYLTRGLHAYGGLDKLCIEGTKFILIEPPFEVWQDWVYETVYKIIVKRGLIPIIAHAERYVDIMSFERVMRLLSMNVYVQVNADSYLNFTHRRFIKRLIKNHKVHLIGTDAHNSTNRRPRMSECLRKMESNFGRGFIDYIKSVSESVLCGKIPENLRG